MHAAATLLLVLLAAVGLWYRALGRLERARHAAAHACAKAGVQFLDQSVVATRWRLCRDRGGRLRLKTHYRFEFASRGDQRYRGSVSVMGGRAVEVELEPWVTASSPPGIDGDERM